MHLLEHLTSIEHIYTCITHGGTYLIETRGDLSVNWERNM